MSAIVTEPALLAIKAATRDLVRACGKYERVAEVAGVGSVATVSRWVNPAETDMIPIRAALALEAECGIPFVTAALADFHGRILSEPPAGPSTTCIQKLHAGLMREVADVMAEAAEVFGDGQVTPAEAERLDRELGDLMVVAMRMRQSLAARKVGSAAAQEARR